jgi:hypothetical protein
VTSLRIRFWIAALSIVAFVLRPWCWNTPTDPFNRAERAYLWVAANALDAEEAVRG